MKYELTGQTFGKLTVIAPAAMKGGKYYWLCTCACGNQTQVPTYRLTSGKTRSCGCLVRKHGKARKERLYNIWVGMRQRCRDVHAKDYPLYGGRGISVCQAWDTDYLSFRQWAYQNGYNDHLSIDRIDGNGNYCPENCRFVDTKTQNNNLRSNVRYKYNGQSKTLAEWSSILGIPYGLLLSRRKRGWSFERMIHEGAHRKNV